SERLPSISGHPAHITALFQNLISNATKYNDEEEKVVEIGVTSGMQNGKPPIYETLYIRDNGIGIEERFRDDIFRIFKRLNSEKVYGEGTGAGLTFVKKIVENHGGQIWLESERGHGTTFFFTLARAP
ncbi:MAG: sensor histidine kinase, partial [Geminicoccaceae bacterium]